MHIPRCMTYKTPSINTINGKLYEKVTGTYHSLGYHSTLQIEKKTSFQYEYLKKYFSRKCENVRA